MKPLSHRVEIEHHSPSAFWRFLGFADTCDGCTKRFEKGDEIHILKGRHRYSGEIILCGECCSSVWFGGNFA